MGILEWLNGIDTQIFLALNGSHNAFFDHFFTFFTSKETWYPLYLLLVVVVLRKYKMQGLWVLLFLILAVAVSDQLSGFVKELSGRLRPSHAPGLVDQINIPAGKGGKYSFFSAHAANSFSLAVLVAFLAKRKRIWIGLILWALVTSYSRIYVGVHYFFDVLVGAVVGSLIGWGAAVLLRIFDDHFQRKRIALAGRWKSKQYTPVLIALLFTTTSLLIASFILLEHL